VAELVFFSGTMDCGKSTLALQMDHNHRQRGRQGLIFTRLDRAGSATLSSRLGLSTAATKRRVDRLRFSGVIRRFTTDIEPAALGWTIEAFVEVYCEGRVPPDRMRELVSTIPEVAEAYTVTGEADGILRVRAADTGHFEKVLGIIRNHPGVSRTRSSLVLSRL